MINLPVLISQRLSAQRHSHYKTILHTYKAYSIQIPFLYGQNENTQQTVSCRWAAHMASPIGSALTVTH